MTLIHVPYINKDICLLKKKKISYMYINKDICLPKKKKCHSADHILMQEPIMCVQLIYYRVNNS